LLDLRQQNRWDDSPDAAAVDRKDSVALSHPSPASDVYTVGHSTHALDDLVALLRRHEIAQIADVRIIPASRRLPHFSRERLVADLPRHGIAYEHLKDLGGRRRAAPDSPNTGWKNAGFRGYADHMQTEAFESALSTLERLAAERRTAVMCAEALWWRCHRRLIADALVARGHDVLHIGSDGSLTEHGVTPFAEIHDGRVRYPPEQPRLSAF
jgi:uncharacterized protein (DUF488 family)